MSSLCLGVSVVKILLPPRAEGLEAGNGGEGLAAAGDGVAELFDGRLVELAELSAGAQDQVADLVRVQLHEPATGGINGDEVGAHDQHSHRPGSAVERTVS